VLASDTVRTAFVRVNVVPMDSERVLRDHTVLVENGRITRIGPASEVKAPTDAQQIDGRGELYLMPGLCDSHMHVLDPDEFVMYVANGVTTVRNMSGEPFHLQWRREIAEGRRFGPTLLTASPTIDGVPPEGSNRQIVTSREEGELVVNDAHAAGYDMIKVYGGLSVEAHAGVVSAAKHWKMPVVGHLPRATGLEGALAAGQSSIDHAEEYLYTYFKDAGVEKIPDAVQLTKEAGAWVTPTLVTFDMIGRQIADAKSLATRPELRVCDPEIRARWLTKNNRYLRDFEPADAERFADLLVFLKKLVRELHRAGVPLLAGTDAGVAFGVPFVLPGYSLHEELTNLVECGLTPYAALSAATTNPARFMHQEHDVGVVAVGARADLLLLESNPLESVANAQRRVGVMLRGRWIPAKESAAMLDTLERLYRDETEFVKGLRADGIAKAAAKFKEARVKNVNARLFREATLNSIGYDILSGDRTADAIAVFELNVEAYPQSADAYDSLGEAYMRSGDKPRAVASYTRSLELNPASENARKMLADLGR
jgi:imidazolonepropionase-like amidohydrolase